MLVVTIDNARRAKRLRQGDDRRAAGSVRDPVATAIRCRWIRTRRRARRHPGYRTGRAVPAPRRRAAAAGDVFCAGAHLGEMKALGEADYQENLAAALRHGGDVPGGAQLSGAGGGAGAGPGLRRRRGAGGRLRHRGGRRPRPFRLLRGPAGPGAGRDRAAGHRPHRPAGRPHAIS